MNGETKACTTCKVEKPLEDFIRSRRTAGGRGPRCRACENIRSRRYKASPEALARKNEAARVKAAQRYANPNERAILLLRQRQSRARRRAEAIQHYGNSCACCGEARIPFLTLDHIDGGGTKIRRTLRASGSSGGSDNLQYVRKHGYPRGFRVLCWNCNCALGLYGRCPHAGDLAQHITRGD